MEQRKEDSLAALRAANFAKEHQEAEEGLFSIYGGPLLNAVLQQGMKPEGGLQIAIYGAGPTAAEDLVPINAVFPNAVVKVSDLNGDLDVSKQTWEDMDKVLKGQVTIHVDFAHGVNVLDPNKMPKSGSQDVVIARGLLRARSILGVSVPDPVKALAEMVRSLHTGGVIAIGGQETVDEGDIEKAFNECVGQRIIQSFYKVPLQRFDVIATPVNSFFIGIAA